MLKHFGSGPGRIPVPAKIPFDLKFCCFCPQTVAPGVWQQPHLLGGRVMVLMESQWRYSLGWKTAEVAF